MGFSAKLEADLTNWSGNLNKAGKEFSNFATDTQKDINAINNSFAQINGKSIGGLQNRLTLLKQNLENATDIKSIAKYNIRIRDTQEEISRLKNLGLQAGNATKNIVTPSSITGLDNLTKSFGSANGVAMEFNRIIQDAPFGMIGIGNNIQQLTANFAQLKAQTGSTKEAVKQAFSSMISSGNLLSLAVSVITSAWTVYTLWSQKADKSTKDLNKSTDTFIDTLTGLNRAYADGQNNAQKDLVSLKLLYDATQNLSLSQKDRLQAADELIKQYPKQFDGLKNEEILAGKASVAYDKLTKSITATAMAAAYANKITENSQKQLNNYLEIIDKQNKYNKLALDIEKARKDNRSSTISAIGESARGFEIQDLQIQQKDLMKDINELGKQNSDITKENALLQSNYNNQIAQGADLSGNLNTSLDDSAKKAQQLAEEMANVRQQLQGVLMSSFQKELYDINNRYDELSKKYSGNKDLLGLIYQAQAAELLRTRMGQIVEEIAPLSQNKDAVNKSFEASIPDIAGAMEKRVNDYASRYKNLNAKLKVPLDDMEKMFKTTSDNISKSLKTGLVDSISNTMSSLGDALATGGNILGALGNSLVSTLGNLAKSIGEQLIAFGTAGIALKFMITNPYLALAAGAALVALGSFATSSVSKTVDQGTKGGYFGYQSQDYSSYRGGLFDSNRTQTVNLQIKGTDLVGALNLNNNRNNRLS